MAASPGTIHIRVKTIMLANISVGTKRSSLLTKYRLIRPSSGQFRYRQHDLPGNCG
jgi:hypothetical protein